MYITKRALIFGICIVPVLICAVTNEQITKKWLESKTTMRQLLLDRQETNELDQFDEKLLNEIMTRNFVDTEKETADLLQKVVLERNYLSTNNAALALVILQDKCSNKNYFFDTAYTAASYKFISNYYILSAVLRGLGKYMTADPAKVFTIVSVISDYIDLYIYDPQRYGTQIVIADLIAFLREYIQVAGNDHIDTKYDTVISDLYAKLGLGEKSSSFDNYQGASDLKKEYFFYMDGKSKTK